jgi:hypothetical protein
MENYTLNELRDIFRNHAVEFEIELEKSIERHKENYPDTPLPQHFLDPFNLSRALEIICEKIGEVNE